MLRLTVGLPVQVLELTKSTRLVHLFLSCVMGSGYDKSKLKNRLEVEIYIIDSCGIRLNTKKHC